MPGFLYQTIRMGKSARQQRETEIESVSKTVKLKVKNSIGHEMDSWRKHLVMDTCD